MQNITTVDGIKQIRVKIDKRQVGFADITQTLCKNDGTS